MDNKALLAVKGKLEALLDDDVADDAKSVRENIVDVCHEILDERAMALMRQDAATVASMNDLTVQERLRRISVIIDNSCKAAVSPQSPLATTMFFEELADQEMHSNRVVKSGGYSHLKYSYASHHTITTATSPAGTTITITVVCEGWASACPGDGKKEGRFSIANIKTLADAAAAGASQAVPTKEE